jgi:hypothetical protein
MPRATASPATARVTTSSRQYVLEPRALQPRGSRLFRGDTLRR